MEPELQTATESSRPANTDSQQVSTQPGSPRTFAEKLHQGRELHGVEWALIGPSGLRSGWAILLFAALYYVFRLVAGTILYSAGLIGDSFDNSATAVIVEESIPLVALVGASALMALFESRPLTAYNLTGPRRALSFASGFLAGFVALSLLVGLLNWGGWLRLTQSSTPLSQGLRFAALWGVAFLFVGLVEEGLFRCYALFTLSRGINFWWALAAQVVACSYVAFKGSAHGAMGVYLAAVIGLLPCLTLHRKSAGGSPFWQAAWVTSTVFAFYHTSNNGETWIGIFAAASIGFVFCVSVRLTGSALWAIGCHAAWDWAETFFYGTADSGLESRGHLFASNPVGNPLWSGGSDGPEGSLLVLAVILVLLLSLIVLYGKKPRGLVPESSAAQ